MASFFTFLATASFVYIDHFGLARRRSASPSRCNAIGFFGSSQFAAWLAGASA